MGLVMFSRKGIMSKKESSLSCGTLLFDVFTTEVSGRPEVSRTFNRIRENSKMVSVLVVRTSHTSLRYET